MALLGLQDIHYTIGGLNLFAGVGLQLEPGDRLCLVGRNGAGKSTLLGLMGGRISPDRGEVSRRQGLRIAGLAEWPGTSMMPIRSPGSRSAPRCSGWARCIAGAPGPA